MVVAIIDLFLFKSAVNAYIRIGFPIALMTQYRVHVMHLYKCEINTDSARPKLSHRRCGATSRLP